MLVDCFIFLCLCLSVAYVEGWRSSVALTYQQQRYYYPTTTTVTRQTTPQQWSTSTTSQRLIRSTMELYGRRKKALIESIAELEKESEAEREAAMSEGDSVVTRDEENESHSDSTEGTIGTESDASMSQEENNADRGGDKSESYLEGEHKVSAGESDTDDAMESGSYYDPTTGKFRTRRRSSLNTPLLQQQFEEALAEHRKTRSDFVLDPRVFEHVDIIMRPYPPRKKKGPLTPNTWRKNLPRKLKRRLKHITAQNLTETVLTSDIDSYLRTEAKGAIYVTLMKKIKIAAYRNNVTIPEGFGLKEKKVRPTIVEMMESSGNFTTMHKAIVNAGLTELLSNTTQLMTIFAPADVAFSTMDSAKVDAWIEDKEKVEKYIRHHVVPGCINTRRLAKYVKEKKLVALDESVLSVRGSKPDEMEVDGVSLTVTDIECQRAIIQTIEKAVI